MGLQLGLGFTALRASGGGPAPAAPVIVTPGSIDEQPLVGQALLLTEPDVTGATSTAYQWYEGDPDTADPISGATSASFTPTATEYALTVPIWRRATYTNATGPTVEDLEAPAIVGVKFQEDFAAFTDGDDTTDIVAAGWTRWSSHASVQYWAGVIGAEAGGPSGKAIRYSTTTGGTTMGAARTDWYDFFNTNGWQTRYQYLALFKADGEGARLAIRSKTGTAVQSVVQADIGAGLNVRLNVPALCLPGEDINVSPAPGIMAALTANELYFVRGESEGAVEKIKIWLATDPEPSTWTLTRTHSGAITGRGPGLHARTSGDAQSVLFLSCAGNADAPFWPGYVSPPAGGADPMEYTAPAPATSFEQNDGLIVWTWEDA
jgi:hypothetical protein